MIVINIAGGTGSGKTTLANKIKDSFRDSSCQIIRLDNYYLDRSHLPPEKRDLINYDHPDSIDADLLIEQVSLLNCGESIEIPVYDFKTHTRFSNRSIHMKPSPLVIIEGILSLYYESLRKITDLGIFVDTESDIRFCRRLSRDISERGRSLQSVINQYFQTVKPMHDAYVEPTKKYADIIVPEGGENERVLIVLRAFVSRLLGSSDSDGLRKS